MKMLKKSDYEALAAFRYTLRRFLHFSETAAESAGLTPQQHQAMVVIKGFPGRSRVTVGELAERLLILHHSAVGLVDRLAAQGLVEREVAEEDRRQVYVSLTPQGEQVLDQLAVYHQEELRRIGTNLAQSIEDLIKEEPELAVSIKEKAGD
jgi:DNA-binding MarR family transcriptional regulator